MNDMRRVEFPPEPRMMPNETPVRLRRDFTAEDDRVAANAILNAAECASCAFRHVNECRAWPPRPLADGRPVWPRIELNAWCGCWRAM